MKGSTRIVEIVDYDPYWPQAYRNERSRILTVISYPSIAVEHIGSTAVPGLAAKPIVDIMVGVARLRDAVDCIARLAVLGYRYVPAVEVHMPYRRFLRKERDGRRTHHLHILEHSHDAWHHHLLFRDYLRSHPEVACDYEQLKRSLARRHRFEVASYTQGKSDFVRTILKRAQRQNEFRRPSRHRGFTYEVVLQAIAQTI
jgi:GrpB-like predicted nucleotidyltransferase (UPF0157 family)